MGINDWRLVIDDRERWNYLIRILKASEAGFDFRLNLYGEGDEDSIQLRKKYVAERRRLGRTFAAVAFRVGWLRAEECIEMHGEKSEAA